MPMHRIRLLPKALHPCCHMKHHFHTAQLKKQRAMSHKTSLMPEATPASKSDIYIELYSPSTTFLETTHKYFNSRFIPNISQFNQKSSSRQSKMNATPQNSHGQGVSHATHHSKVPEKVQEAAPASLERKLPENVHSLSSFLFWKLKAHKISGSSNGQVGAEQRQHQCLARQRWRRSKHRSAEAAGEVAGEC